MLSTHRFEQEQMGFLFCNWLVLHTFGDDVELTWIDDHCLVSHLQLQLALHHHEQLILIIVFVEDKFSLNLGKDDLLSIEFPDSLRRPVIVEEREFLRNIDDIHDDPLSGVREKQIQFQIQSSGEVSADKWGAFSL